MRTPVSWIRDYAALPEGLLVGPVEGPARARPVVLVGRAPDHAVGGAEGEGGALDEALHGGVDRRWG